jgi:kynureninase
VIQEDHVNPDPPSPAALRPHYTGFLERHPGRILLTGHSHQAWPDVARAAQLEAFDDAAEHVDEKWARAFAAGDAVRHAVVRHLGLPDGRADDVALAGHTHELVVRVLSCADLRARPHLLTTRGEFHTIYRQLSRLAEAGLEVEFVDPTPVDTLAERLAARVGPRTAAVLVSTVLFESATPVPHLGATCEAASRHGALVVLDAYHQAGVRAFDATLAQRPDVFVVGGGYKYLQWGEGNAYLVVPAGGAHRPAYTGWFADFAHLSARRERAAPVSYGTRGKERFAGSTYEPTSHYRARAVAAFFEEVGLTPSALHASYARQTLRLLRALAPLLDGRGAPLSLVSPAADAERGGFVAVRVPGAAAVVAALRARGVWVDARGDVLRLGPAPYLTDDELEAGVAALAEVVRGR